uniref:Uncharacterized protein n=1 Tax=Brassica oleracea TaxID=3712 RepID=A0A3P6GMY4_BRAOL|nr:unnamed protein product [Brassica oleracea]
MVLSYYDYFTTLSLVPYFLLFVYHSSNPKPPENQHTYEERKEKMKDLIGAANTEPWYNIDSVQGYSLLLQVNFQTRDFEKT